jgi:type II secretory pathway pseudopilin PulG
MIKKNKFKNSGYILIQVIVFSLIAVYILGALVNWSITSVKSSRHDIERESTFQIAEAGIDYYRWHLSEATTDYQDGTGHNGPYVHDFYNTNNDPIGQFTLEITPPSSGSDVVIIKSTGETNSNPNMKKTLVTKLDLKSNKYTTVSWEEVK